MSFDGKVVRVGMVGAGLMAKLHSVAFTVYPMYFWKPSAMPVLSVICDISEELAKTGKDRYGYKDYVTDWKDLVKRDDVDLVDVGTPNFLHKNISIAAMRNGKHVYCEKPLALNAEEAKEMLDEAQKTGVIHAIGYNNRCVPAVAMAKKLITEGRIGNILNCRMEYLQDWAISPLVPMEWRLDAKAAGSGALGDIGSHAIDLARFLVGEFKQVLAMSRTLVKERPVSESSMLGGRRLSEKDVPSRLQKVTVDDSVEFMARFENGATGLFHASRFGYGRKNTLAFEIYGSKGSLVFSSESLCELKFYSGDDAEDLQGFKAIKMGRQHPYGEAFWPLADSGMGYADLKSIEISALINAISGKGTVSADFEDGYRAMLICDAVKKSVDTKEWVTIPQSG